MPLNILPYSRARSSSRGSPYSSHAYGAYSSTNINAAMHHQNTGYQDYSSMYPAMDPMGIWVIA